MSEQHRYDRQGYLALDPRAFLATFDAVAERGNVVHSDVSVVSVRGPLEHHAGTWMDSYSEIIERVSAACDTPARAVALRIDSPGGTVAGMLDTARAVRARCDAAGKRLLAYVDGQACSAAYALACAADAIVVDESAIVGSIGVISTRLDLTEQAAGLGMKVAIVASGARKADGHPHLPITETELAAQQTIVDALASGFFAHVAACRGVAVEEIAALDAGVFVGADAVGRRLADAVGSFDSLLVMVASPQPAASAEGRMQMDHKEEARKALLAILDAEDADEATKARARKALAAMDEEEPEEKSSDEEKPVEEDESAKASARVSASTAGELAAVVARQGRLLEQLRAERDGERRDALLASRPDLPAELRKVLASKSFEEARSIVDAMPRASVAVAAAASVPVATRGEGQGEGGVSRLSSNAKAELDARMGLLATKPGVIEQGNRLILGAAVPAKGV